MIMGHVKTLVYKLGKVFIFIMLQVCNSDVEIVGVLHA